MKLYLPLLSSVIILASCSTAYETGQTPDDVYFSPARERDEYVRIEEKDEREYRGQLQNEEEWREDRYLRMKTSYRRYSALDDYEYYTYHGGNYNRYNDYYRYNTYRFTNNFCWGWNYGLNYNAYYYNPYYNKPYYSGYVAGNVIHVYNKPRGSNLHTYNNSGTNYNANYPKSKGRTYSNSASQNDNYRESGTNAGGFLRNIFGSGSTSSNSNSTNSSSNSSGNSSSSPKSSGSSNSGSSSAPVRKF